MPVTPVINDETIKGTTSICRSRRKRSPISLPTMATLPTMLASTTPWAPAQLRPSPRAAPRPIAIRIQ